MLLRQNMPDRCLVYAHRGGAGLRPESTLAAYQHAIDLGVDVLDIDISITKDGVIVASHDPFLSPDFTRDAQGEWLNVRQPILIKNLTFEELQQFDVSAMKPGSDYAKAHPERQFIPAATIPSLQQIFDIAKPHASINYQLEVKTDPTQPHVSISPNEFMSTLNALLEDNQIASRVEVHSFDWRNMLQLQVLNSAVRTSYITSTKWITPELAVIWQAGHVLKYGSNYTQLIADLGGQTWCPDFRDITTKNLIEMAHKKGLRVTSWTVNKLDNMQKLLDYKIDGIITDYPDRLMALLAVDA